MISKYRCAVALRGSAPQIGRKIVAVENVVTQNQHGMMLPDEFAADDKGLRQTVGRGLHLVLKVYTPVSACTKEPRKQRRVIGRRNNQDIANPRQHQRAEWIVNQRFVINRQELFRHRLGERVEPRPRSARQDDPFAALRGRCIGLKSSCGTRRS